MAEAKGLSKPVKMKNDAQCPLQVPWRQLGRSAGTRYGLRQPYFLKISHGKPPGELNLMEIVFHGCCESIKSIIQSIKMAQSAADVTYPNIHKILIFCGPLENGYALNFFLHRRTLLKRQHHILF